MIEILTKRREPRGALDPEEEDLLCDPASDPKALADLLLDLYREQVWLRCGCGWTFHVRGGHTLARNPGQTEPLAEPCALCRAWPYRRGLSSARERERLPGDSGITLIPTGRRRRQPERRAQPERSGSGRHTMKYATMFRTLWTVMEGAGLLALDGPLEATVLWRRVREVLALSPLYAEEPEGMSYADLAWTPASRETPREILERVGPEWKAKGIRAQVWIFGIVDRLPRATGERLCFAVDGVHHRVEIDLHASHRKVVGQTGPHLVFVQATHEPERGIGYDKLAAQGILAADCPVPVDSSHERDALRLIQQQGLNYYKPCFSYVEDLKPDVMLLDRNVLVEVQGMRTEDYAAHKREIHERMLTHPALRGWRLITYTPHLETLAEFRAKLRNGGRPR